MTLQGRLTRVEAAAGREPPALPMVHEVDPEHLAAVTAALVAGGHLVVIEQGDDEDGGGELALPDGRRLSELPEGMAVLDILQDAGARALACELVAASADLDQAG